NSVNGVIQTSGDTYTVGTGVDQRNIDAYEKYWEDHVSRQRIILVGSNDGMLHAFDAGTPADSPPVQDPTSPFRRARYNSGPGYEDEQVWGQTWGQFSPRPPPIVPVLLQTSNTAGPTNYGYPHTEERWVAFLNGGHGPFNNRGRAAALVDVFTGSPLFKATYD